MGELLKQELQKQAPNEGWDEWCYTYPQIQEAVKALLTLELQEYEANLDSKGYEVVAKILEKI